MRYVVGARSGIGRCRPSNQDSVLVKRAVLGEEEVVMALVCDGVGGLSHGELASASVVRCFDSWFTFQLPRLLFHRSFEEIGNIWSAKLGEISQTIRKYGQERGESMGTTCSGLLLAGGESLLLHVGDSRIYRLRGCVSRLTTDQTWAERAARMGAVDENRGRNLLLQCVGVSQTLNPEIQVDGCRAGDVYLLCSDGFWHTSTEGELWAAFGQGGHSREGIESACDALIERAMERGERDNISLAVIEVEG